MEQTFSHTLVGDGKVARHLSHYFKLLGLRFAQWRRADSPAAVPAADVTWLLVSDDAIEKFIQAHPELIGRRLVHCSGRLVIEGAAGYHPLMSFASTNYTLEIYKSIAFIGERERAGEPSPLVDLPNQVYYVPARERAYYHSLCVLGGNFPVMLWQKFVSELSERWQIPLAACAPYLEQTLTNFKTLQAEALTGPLVRGDKGTVAEHLRVLRDDPYLSVYTAFIEAFGQMPSHSLSKGENQES